MALDITTINERRRWSARDWGKEGYRLPEQYTREWDMYTRDPTDPPLSSNLPPSKIAGQYNEKSNIFQVGWTMLAVITKLDPLWLGSPPNAATIVATMPTLGPRAEQDAFVFETHGWVLDRPDYNKYSRRLREAVELCLAHEPDIRPELEELVNECAEMVASYPADRPPADKRQNWARRYFSQVPPAGTAAGDAPWDGVAEVGPPSPSHLPLSPSLPHPPLDPGAPLVVLVLTLSLVGTKPRDRTSSRL